MILDLFWFNDTKQHLGATHICRLYTYNVWCFDIAGTFRRYVLVIAWCWVQYGIYFSRSFCFGKSRRRVQYRKENELEKYIPLFGSWNLSETKRNRKFYPIMTPLPQSYGRTLFLLWIRAISLQILIRTCFWVPGRLLYGYSRMTEVGVLDK